MSPNITIVVSQFNKEISTKLLNGALEAYKNIHGNTDSVNIIKVSGAFEIPGTVKQVIDNDENIDAIVTLGSVIKGETAHFEYISSSVTDSLSQLSIYAKIPIIYGILTTYTLKQAIERADSNQLNKGGEVMQAALDSMHVYKNISN